MSTSDRFGQSMLTGLTHGWTQRPSHLQLMCPGSDTEGVQVDNYVYREQSQMHFSNHDFRQKSKSLILVKKPGRCLLSGLELEACCNPVLTTDRHRETSPASVLSSTLGASLIPSEFPQDFCSYAGLSLNR